MHICVPCQQRPRWQGTQHNKQPALSTHHRTWLDARAVREGCVLALIFDGPTGWAVFSRGRHL